MNFTSENSTNHNVFYSLQLFQWALNNNDSNHLSIKHNYIWRTSDWVYCYCRWNTSKDTNKNRYIEYKPTNEVVTKLWFMNQWK